MTGYKVLVVEDSPTMRQLIVFALKRIRGFQIVEANDGVDGLKKLSAEKFDLILAMDNANFSDLIERCPEEYQPKVRLMTEFCQTYADESEVPDPYYGGAAGFEFVLDLIEDASDGLLHQIKNEPN